MAKSTASSRGFQRAGPALKDLLGGIIDVAFDPGVGLASARAGKLRMIAIAGPKRHPDFPDTPTLEENEVITLMQEPVVSDRFKALGIAR